MLRCSASEGCEEMKQVRDKVIGILGGMGPEATAELFWRIIKATPVRSEQDHLRIIIDNNPKIPERTRAVLGEGESSIYEMIKTALNLEKAGAEIIVMPCNTAHYYLADLRQNVQVPVIDMIWETANYISQQFAKMKKVGLLATNGSVKAELYQNRLESREVLLPDKDSQDEVMKVIFSVKLGHTRGPVRKKAASIAQLLVDRGAEAIIAGCTELSLVLAEQEISVPLIDPLQILAAAAVREARAKE